MPSQQEPPQEWTIYVCPDPECLSWWHAEQPPDHRSCDNWDAHPEGIYPEVVETVVVPRGRLEEAEAERARDRKQIEALCDHNAELVEAAVAEDGTDLPSARELAARVGVLEAALREAADDLDRAAHRFQGRGLPANAVQFASKAKLAREALTVPQGNEEQAQPCGWCDGEGAVRDEEGKLGADCPRCHGRTEIPARPSTPVFPDEEDRARCS